MANPLTNALTLLQDFGFFDVLLPLLLIFFIIYAILIRTKILGDADKGYVRAINAIVSAIVAFFFVTQTSLVQVLREIIPRSALLLVITMLILILLGFVGVYNTDVFESKGAMWAVAIPLILIFLGVLDASGLYVPGIHQIMLYFSGAQELNISQETVNIGIAVIIVTTVVGLIAWITSKSD